MTRAIGVRPLAFAVVVVVTAAPIACSSEGAEPARSVEQHDAGSADSSTATTDSGSADGAAIVEDGGPDESRECFLRIGGQVIAPTTCHAPELLSDAMVVRVYAGSHDSIQITVREPPLTGSFDGPSIDGRVLFFRSLPGPRTENIEGRVSVVHAGQPDDLYEGSAKGTNVVTQEEIEVRWRFKGPSYDSP